MRTELRNYLAGLKLKNYKVSDELPFSNSGTAMYLKNPKVLYIDDDQTTSEPFISMMNGTDVEAEVLTSRVYFSTDAKQKPTDYATVVNSIKAWKYVTTNTQYFKRECDVITEFENDLQITQFEFRFTKLS